MHLGRPVRTASDLDPPAQCVSPGVSAKLQNRSAASPHRAGQLQLNSKHQRPWSNFRCQGHRNPRPLLRYSASPVLENLKNQRKTKGFQRSRGVQSWAGVWRQNCLCRDLSRALFPSVSTSVSKRFEAFRGLSKPCFQGFEASRGLSRPVRGLGFCANHTVAQHIRGLRGLESI